jgi:hypothetical protein
MGSFKLHKQKAPYQEILLLEIISSSFDGLLCVGVCADVHSYMSLCLPV